MPENYVPFSELQTRPEQVSVVTDITEYKPGNSLPAVQNCHPVLTHCYVCGTGWNYGYWKHCGCNTVPVGDGGLPLGVLIVVYLLWRWTKK